MTVAWVGVAAAVVGGAASYMGSKKQADAATKAANLSQGQYQNNVGMQQPYVNSGYGALSKMNTLMGINPDPNAPKMMPSQPSQNVAPAGMTWNGPAQQLTDTQALPRIQPNSMPQSNPQLRQILSIRASNGDPQAKQMLSMMS